MTLQVLFSDLSFLVFTGFFIYLLHRYGIIRSLSKSYYLLKGDKEIFILSTIGYGVFLGVAGGTLLTYIAGGLVALVGVFPEGKGDDLKHYLHSGFATGAILVSMLSMGLDFNIWSVPIIYIPLAFLSMKLPVKNHTLYIEVIAFYIVWSVIRFNIVV